MHIKVFSAFAGYDSPCLALDRLCRDNSELTYDLVGWSEIDESAIKAHNALYPQWADRNYGDISAINWEDVPDFDLFVYTFPCQDISDAGLQRGFDRDSGTRSSLLWQCEKAIASKRPKYLLAENVPAIVGKKNKHNLDQWLKILELLGYRTDWRLLNAEDYGVAQHRRRFYAVSVLNGNGYTFPQPLQPLAKCVSDYADTNPATSLFLQSNRLKKIRETLNVDRLLDGCRQKQRGCRQIAESYNVPHAGGRVYDTSASAATMTSKVGHSTTYANALRLRVVDNYGDNMLFAECVSVSARLREDTPLSAMSFVGYTRSSANKGRDITFHLKGSANVIHGSTGTGRNTDQYIAAVCEFDKQTQIPCIVFSHDGLLYALFVRRLSPSECFRLMDVDESAIEQLLASGNSNHKLYRLAGNAVVVACLYHIFRSLLISAV